MSPITLKVNSILACRHPEVTARYSDISLCRNRHFWQQLPAAVSNQQLLLPYTVEDTATARGENEDISAPPRLRARFVFEVHAQQLIAKGHASAYVSACVSIRQRMRASFSRCTRSASATMSCTMASTGLTASINPRDCPTNCTP